MRVTPCLPALRKRCRGIDVFCLPLADRSSAFLPGTWPQPSAAATFPKGGSSCRAIRAAALLPRSKSRALFGDHEQRSVNVSDAMVAIAEASTTRRRVMPRTRGSPSTTARIGPVSHASSARETVTRASVPLGELLQVIFRSHLVPLSQSSGFGKALASAAPPCDCLRNAYVNKLDKVVFWRMP